MSTNKNTKLNIKSDADLRGVLTYLTANATAMCNDKDATLLNGHMIEAKDCLLALYRYLSDKLNQKS